MNRVKKIRAILDTLFPKPAIPLSHTSPYTLLIAVLLSGRSRDDRVNTVTPYLFSLADTPEKMIQIPEETIRKVITPCGLSPQKAHAIKELSNQLIDRHGGLVPKNFEELERLTGVGHKTASVVMTQSFSLPAFPVDTHIFRCARRWGLSQGKTPKKVEEDLKTLFPKKQWGKVHLQIIYFARNYCRANRHNPKECPICSWIQGKS